MSVESGGPSGCAACSIEQNVSIARMASVNKYMLNPHYLEQSATAYLFFPFGFENNLVILFLVSVWHNQRRNFDYHI